MKYAIFLAVGIASQTWAKSAEELLAAGTPEQQAAAIVAELATRNAGYRDLVGSVEMTLTDGSGVEARRAFSLKLLERSSATDGDRSLIIFESPADVKGTAVLSHAAVAAGEDEQWLFVPSTKRTRRISSSNRGGAFVGSEFTFEDLTGNDGRKYQWAFVGTKPCGAASCLELSATPSDENSAYSRRVLLVDKLDLHVVQVDFFDRRGALLKTLAYSDYVTLNERFRRAQLWTMRNVQTGKTTTIHFTAMKLGTGLTANDFSTHALSR